MSKVEPKDLKAKNKRDKLLKWLLYTVIYVFFVSILYGTVDFYFGTAPFIGGLYISWAQFFLMTGLFGWTIMTYFVLGKDI